jgi:signal transduction histidine kinase
MAMRLPAAMQSPAWRIQGLMAVLAMACLALLTWLLPNPQAAQGVAVFAPRTMEPTAMLLHVYLGAVLAIVLMNLVFWSWLGERLYLNCAALLAAGLVYTSLRYQTPGLPLPESPRLEALLGIVYCGFCIVATAFFSQLFEFRRNALWAARVFELVVWFNTAALVVALAGRYADISRAVVFMALLSTAFGTLFVAYLLLVRRRWQYLPGALAFVVPVLLSIVSQLALHGVLPAAWVPDAPVLWFVGRLAEVLLLALTVASRTRLAERALHEERAGTLERALAAEQVLEAKVRERTGELQQAQNALQIALSSERDMRLEQRQFFSMVNHEFRTPLMVADSAAAELHAFPPDGAQELQERAGQIRRACRRLMALADSCLVNDRLDDQAFRPRLEQVRLAQLVEEPAELVRWSPRHRLHLDLAQAPETWECDATLTSIALSNLVSNAIKYARGGQIGIAAHCNAQGALCLSVTDEGAGLPPGEIERLFERYERGSAPRMTSGYGLGLWVARRIAQLHGGEVQFSAAPDGPGACFTLVLSAPVKAPMHLDAAQELGTVA